MLANIMYLIVFMFHVNVCVAKNYKNYTLYRAIAVNETQIEFFSNLKDSYDVNFWREPGVINKAIDFVINPADKKSFLRDALKHDIYLTTIIEDVQDAFDQQTVKSYVRTDKDTFNWNNFFRLDDIYNWLRDIAQNHSEELQIKSIGKSHENRDILAVSIILKNCKTPRSKIIIEGGIHAREWIAPAFVTYLINQILYADASNNKRLIKVANSYEWYFVPVLNVDGYEYTHTTDRLWRKNRHGNGIDLNRNFDHAFGSKCVSFNKNSDIYCGKTAFSEKETFAMASFIRSKSENLKYYIAFHSYGQFMILPYSNEESHLENYDEVHKMCKQASKKIRARHNTQYTIGTAFDTVGYTASGVSSCWVKKSFKVPYVVTFELPDQGQDGFALSTAKILPTCKETMDGLIELFGPQRETLSRVSAPFQPTTGSASKVSKRIVNTFYGFLFALKFI